MQLGPRRHDEVGEVEARRDRTADEARAPAIDDARAEGRARRYDRLEPLAEDKRIVVFGTNAWMNMEPLEAPKLEKLKVALPASTFIDHTAPAVQHFVQAYRDRYNNEPGDYAFLGFDVTYFYLRGLMAFGRALPEHFAEVDARPLHMAFKLNRTGAENGYRNEGGFLLQYQEAGLRPLR